jgi:hypothetical protein
MPNVKISLCASALRPNQWQATYESLKQNSIEWELIYTGPNEPNFTLLSNFIYIKSNVKPAQCYQISFNRASGQLLAWTADDVIYPANALDNMYNFFTSFNNNKLVAAFRTVEDGKDITEVHRFRGRDGNSPRMAPFGVVNREMFNELGGYDRDFICGQSENDVVMRFYEAGGILEVSNIPVYVKHQEAHREGTVFRTGYYHEDRRVLEEAWISDNKILNKRKYPVNSFVKEGILISTQGQKGRW